MKRILLIFCLILACCIFSACSLVGKSNKAKINIGKSKQFTDQEINDAVVQVKKKFKAFRGCELTDLWYDEEKSNSIIKGYMKSGHGSVNGINSDNVIVLLSNFDVGSYDGGDTGFESNSTYSDWNWILIRDDKNDKWRVDDYGY